MSNSTDPNTAPEAFDWAAFRARRVADALAYADELDRAGAPQNAAYVRTVAQRIENGTEFWVR